jgi:AcrR family transcriptional regulator
VGRHKEPHRRAKLLEAIADYVLERGLAELALRPLAQAVGTSPRILLYHFGSKEELVASALKEARARETATVETYRASMDDVPLADQLRTAWEWISASSNHRFLRLFFEVYGLSLQDPKRFPGFLEAVVSDWLPLVEASLCAGGTDPVRARALAPLIVATQRGLLLDLLATGDRQRVDRAYDQFLACLVGPTTGVLDDVGSAR